MWWISLWRLNWKPNKKPFWSLPRCRSPCGDGPVMFKPVWMKWSLKQGTSTTDGHCLEAPPTSRSPSEPDWASGLPFPLLCASMKLVPPLCFRIFQKWRTTAALFYTSTPTLLVCVHSPGSAVLNTLSFFKITAILSAARNKGTFTIQTCLLKAIRKKWGSGQRRILQTNKNNNNNKLAQLLLIFDMKLI